MPLPPVDPIADLVWRELRPVLDEELNRLPAKYRDPVVLCYLENKTNVDEDLTPEQLHGLTPHYVKSIDEVLEIALPTSAKEERQDAEEREKVLSTQDA